MSLFALLLVPFSCLSFLVWLMRWTHTTSHISQILHCRSYGWYNVVGCSCVLLLLWGWWLLIVGNCFAVGLRGTTPTILSASGNYWKKSMLIASIIISQHTQGLRKITYLPLMALMTKSLCISIWDSAIPVLLLEIQRSARYRISRSLLLPILLLAIQLRRKFNWRELCIIGWIGVTAIVCYLMERYVWRWVSGTAMFVGFGFGGGPTTVNTISMTALHRIMNPSFVSLNMFSVWLFHNNYDFLG